MEKSLAIIGPSALQGVFEDLEKRGVRMESGMDCSVHQLDSIFSEIFGEDASRLMMSKICRELYSD